MTSVRAAAETVRSRYIALEVLVNVNTGGMAPAPLPAGHGDSGALEDSWAATFSTNVSSVAVMCDAFLPLLHDSEVGPSQRVCVFCAYALHSPDGRHGPSN